MGTMLTEKQIKKSNLIDAFMFFIQDGFIITRQEAIRLNQAYPNLKIEINKNKNGLIINL